jgi:hypothetical protein
MAETEAKRGARVSWAALCEDSDYRGMWVALHGVTYESGVPLEGNLVDAHEDLGELCARIQLGDRTGCAVLFCDDKGSGIRRAT